MKTENDCVLIKKRDYAVLKGNYDELIKKHEQEKASLLREIEDLKNKPAQIDPIKLTLNLTEEINRYEMGIRKEYYVQPFNYIKESNIDLEEGLCSQILRIARTVSQRVIKEREIKVNDLKTQIYNDLWEDLSSMTLIEKISYIRSNIKKRKNETK